MIVAVVLPLLSYTMLCRLSAVSEVFVDISRGPGILLAVTASELAWYAVKQSSTGVAIFTAVNNGVLIPAACALVLYRKYNPGSAWQLAAKASMYSLPFVQLLCVVLTPTGRTFAAVGASVLGVIASWLIVQAGFAQAPPRLQPKASAPLPPSNFRPNTASTYF